jgi:hypothetical protein
VRPSRWAVALVASTVFVALAGGGARADSGGAVTEFGWWTQVPGATTQAGGGFQVADSPAGQLSVAAIRISITASSLVSAKLVLPEAQQIGSAIVQVCRTTSTWTAASPGTWDKKPTPDCATPIPLVRDAASTSWSADVMALLSSGPGEVSLMVVPGPPPAGLPAPAPFQVSLGGAELQSEAGAALPDPVAAPAPAESGFTDTFGAASSVGSPSDFGVPAPLPTPVVEPSAPNQQVAAAPAQTPGRFPSRNDAGAPGGGEKKPWGRLPVLTLAAALVGAGTSVGRSQLRERGLLA